MKMISESEEAGVLILVNTMRPDVLAERLGAVRQAPYDPTSPLREYGHGAQILKDLGVRKMIVLSPHKPTRAPGIEGYGLSLEGWRQLKQG